MMTNATSVTSEEIFRLLNKSFRRFIGSPLAPAGKDASWLYEQAPFAVIAHNAEPDPRFIYANRTAQKCFEYSWDEFTNLHSRLSAEAPNRAERQTLLDAVTRNGFATGYRGLRIAKSGRRFWIEDVTVWQLIDDEGQLRGQGAVFPSWKDA